MRAYYILLLSIALGCANLQPTPYKNLYRDGLLEKKDKGYYNETQNFAVATQGKFASEAAKEIYKSGGNVIDAAVAASFVISVERPQSTGLGGGGFMLFLPKGAKKPIVFDFREKAPLAATETMYQDEKGNVLKRKSLDGIFAVGVPGMVAGVLDAHKEFGKLPLKKVLAPAIKLAKDGFKVYPELAKALDRRKDVLNKYEASKKIFFNKNDEIKKEGDLLVQKDLAQTISLIAKKGKDGFYKGTVAKAIIDENQRLNGIMTQEDLDKYNVKRREPVKGTYNGYTVFSMPPPSSGGVHIIQILNTLEKDKLGELGPHHPRSIHLTASAMQSAFADRAEHLGDSDFEDVPIKELTSKEYAKTVRFEIPENIALNWRWVDAGDFKEKFDPFSIAKRNKEKRTKKKQKKESSETTHFTIVDKDGNVVVSTQTLNGYMGSAVVVPGTGVLLNNEMDDFTAKVGAQNLFGAVGGKKNAIKPEKRPLSSMSPTIVLKDDKPVLALGTPSGTRILTCVAQTILNYVEHKMPLYESVAALRYHHQWKPDEIRFEETKLPRRLEKKLRAMRHELRFSNFGCRIQAIASKEGKLISVSDPRGRGAAVGF